MAGYDVDWGAKPTSVAVAVIERPPAAPPPKCQRFIAVVAAQCRRTLDQQPEDHCPIVVGQFDQTGLCHQPAQLDQLPRPLAARHLPLARVMPRQLRQQAVACR